MNARADIPHFTPASNPLSDSAPEDTMRSVHAVLGFVSCALSAMQEQDASEYDLSSAGIGGGLKLIIDTCQEAIGAHVAEEGRSEA